MLTPHEFRHAIKNGTITNYETYLTFPNEKYRIIMAEEGVAIDKLVSLGSSYLITLLVENIMHKNIGMNGQSMKHQP